MITNKAGNCVLILEGKKNASEKLNYLQLSFEGNAGKVLSVIQFHSAAMWFLHIIFIKQSLHYSMWQY